MAKILHVDDDPVIVGQVSQWLSLEGHICEAAYTGGDALQLLNSFVYDVILLDWSLPDMSGVDVCNRFRNGGGLSWIIFLSGKGEIVDKESALDGGGDDYIVKPFDVKELSARVRSVLRRPPTAYQKELKIGPIALDVTQRAVVAHGRRQRLMPKEIAILEFLMRHPDQVFSTKKLMVSVWPSESTVSEGAVRTVMHSLRQKLEDLDEPDFVTTVLGEGYTIKTKAE